MPVKVSKNIYIYFARWIWNIFVVIYDGILQKMKVSYSHSHLAFSILL